jgi:hypothetical protein
MGLLICVWGIYTELQNCMYQTAHGPCLSQSLQTTKILLRPVKIFTVHAAQVSSEILNISCALIFQLLAAGAKMLSLVPVSFKFKVPT